MTTCRVLRLLVASSVLVTACRQPTVETYRVPKETAAAQPAAKDPHAGVPGAPPLPSQGAGAPPAGSAAAPGAMASTPVATAAGHRLAWMAPGNWTVKTGASTMRKGTYTLKAPGVEGEAELAITAFPGDVGGELANVNRWRGQIGLAPITEQELAGALTRIERNGLKIAVLDIGPGSKGERMLGAIVPHGGETWFFKLTGPDALVAKVKPEFMSYLETVKPAPASP